MVMSSPVFLSYGCCNKLSQTWQLKRTHIYYLTVLEVESLKSVLCLIVLKSRCRQSYIAFEGSRRESVSKSAM